MKKKILFLFVGLNLLIISSISMSLAWFLGASSLVIDPFVISVDVDADLKISTVDDKEYAKDSITQEELGSLDELIPVSSMRSFSGDWIKDTNNREPVFFQEYKRGNEIEPAAIIAKKGYFSKTLYLWSDHHMYVTFDCRNNKKGYVDSNGNPSRLISPNEEKNTDKAPEIAEEKALRDYMNEAEKEIEDQGIESEIEKRKIYAKTKEDLKRKYTISSKENLDKVVNSVRFSILDYQNLARKDENDFSSNYTIIDPTKTESSDPVVFGGRLCTSLTRDYYDYFIDSDGKYKETLFGDAMNTDGSLFDRTKLKYLSPLAEDEDREEGEPSCFNAKTQKGVYRLDQDFLKNNVIFEEENSISPEEADVAFSGNESRGYLIELFPGQSHKLVLSVYLEGWDLDNLDSTQEGSFDMSIRFRLYKQGELR